MIKEIFIYLIIGSMALAVSAKVTPIILMHFLEPSLEVLIDAEINRQAGIIIEDSMSDYLSNEENWKDGLLMKNLIVGQSLFN